PTPTEPTPTEPTPTAADSAVNLTIQAADPKSTTAGTIESGDSLVLGTLRIPLEPEAISSRNVPVVVPKTGRASKPSIQKSDLPAETSRVVGPNPLPASGAIADKGYKLADAVKPELNPALKQTLTAKSFSNTSFGPSTPVPAVPTSEELLAAQGESEVIVTPGTSSIPLRSVNAPTSLPNDSDLPSDNRSNE
ncbi:MAG: hypothetical protein O2856_11865, partial [Planctomycetota bacterium]|nr:hypothetical protein [Planctomycetota bacterium]